MSTIDLTINDSDGENDPVGDAAVAYASPTMEWLDANAMQSNPVALRAHATMMSYALAARHPHGSLRRTPIGVVTCVDRRNSSAAFRYGGTRFDIWPLAAPDLVLIFSDHFSRADWETLQLIAQERQERGFMEGDALESAVLHCSHAFKSIRDHGILAGTKRATYPLLFVCLEESLPVENFESQYGGNAYGCTLRAILESEGDWVIKFLGLRDGDSSINHRSRWQHLIMFGIFNRATTRVDERLPTVAVEMFHLLLPDLPHERSRAIKIGPFWYKTDICIGSSIDPKLLQYRQCDHASLPACKCIFGNSDGHRNQKCIDASEVPPLQLRGTDWKPLLPPQPTPQPGPHDSSEAARRLIHARAADKRQARSQREAEDRARVGAAARAREDADLDAAVEASLEAALQAQNRAAASDDDSDEGFGEFVDFVRAAPTKRGHEEEGGETAKRARAEPHDVDLDLQRALLEDAQAANDVDAPPSPTAADPSPDATHPSPMDDDDSDDNSITLDQMREKTTIQREASPEDARARAAAGARRDGVAGGRRAQKRRRKEAARAAEASSDDEAAAAPAVPAAHYWLLRPHWRQSRGTPPLPGSAAAPPPLPAAVVSPPTSWRAGAKKAKRREANRGHAEASRKRAKEAAEAVAQEEAQLVERVRGLLVDLGRDGSNILDDDGDDGDEFGGHLDIEADEEAFEALEAMKAKEHKTRKDKDAIRKATNNRHRKRSDARKKASLDKVRRRVALLKIRVEALDEEFRALHRLN